MKIVVEHHVDEHIEDATLCKPDIDSIMEERPIVCHVVDDFINDDDEQLSPQSGLSDDD